jgi:hypothetical protein
VERFKSSLIAATIGTITIILIALVPYGVISLFFGVFTFPIALIASYCLSYPLNLICDKFKLHQYSCFSLYFVAGFIGGGVMPLLWLESARTLISKSEVGFLLNYGVVGALTASAMYVAASHYSQYNKSSKSDAEKRAVS